MYKYVPKDEIKIFRLLCMDCFDKACESLKDNHGISVEAQGVVGNEMRNFVTKNDDVYSMDYQIMLAKMPENCTLELLDETIREEFDEACLSKMEKGEPCDYALTYLHRAKKSGKINFRVDITIAKIDEDGEEYRLIKDGDKYKWSEPFDIHFLRIEEETIKDWDQWQNLRDEYLKLKNKYLEAPEKHLSLDVYREAVENIYNN